MYVYKTFVSDDSYLLWSESSLEHRESMHKAVEFLDEFVESHDVDTNYVGNDVELIALELYRFLNPGNQNYSDKDKKIVKMMARTYLAMRTVLEGENSETIGNRS